MYKTTVKKKGGKDPVWNERFELAPLRRPNELYFQVFASNIITDEFIGETKMLKLDELELGADNILELSLKDKDNNPRGKIIINIMVSDKDAIVEAESSYQSEESESVS
jgi:hypothetical protein